MFNLLWKKSILVTSFFLLAACTASNPSLPGFVRAYTTQSQYQNLEAWNIVISNTLNSEIMIPTPGGDPIGEATFRFYRKQAAGWQRLIPRPGYLAPVNPGSSEFSLMPNTQLEFDIRPVLASYWAWPWSSKGQDGYLLVQVRYTHRSSAETQDELVVYTNEFAIPNAASLVDPDLVVEINRPGITDLELKNGFSAPIWVPSPCSYVEVYDEDDGYTSLERATDEGTWTVIRPSQLGCSGNPDLIQIDSEQSMTLQRSYWFPANDKAFTPGTYRWNVVFYLENEPGSQKFLRDTRHVYSEPFSVTK